ncbi:MAG: hypothetical protein JOS17DRAFT_822598 [Linnemannia elongata]|nr:MAG: hypothetical protein JOS17DRAFT_822598 [Linnemannia elongata]
MLNSQENRLRQQLKHFPHLLQLVEAANTLPPLKTTTIQAGLPDSTTFLESPLEWFPSMDDNNTTLNARIGDLNQHPADVTSIPGRDTDTAHPTVSFPNPTPSSIHPESGTKSQWRKFWKTKVPHRTRTFWWRYKRDIIPCGTLRAYRWKQDAILTLRDAEKERQTRTTMSLVARAST